MSIDSVHLGELAVLGALAACPDGLTRKRLLAIATEAGVQGAETAVDGLARRGHLRERRDLLRLTPGGIEALLELHARLEQSLDPSAPHAAHEGAQSIPWLTTVQTQWIDALSFNYAVPQEALATLLPAPLEPELHKGCAWIQVLVSSLRDLRPRGAPALFGVNFYQISYRAAVRYRGADGAWRRGGFFARSDTNNEVMRTIGNRLAEFRFHDFGAATMSLLRQGEQLIVGVDPERARPGGKFVAVVPTTPLRGPPDGSVWDSLADLHEPLVECYDALGVDQDAGHVYILTVDRDPWNAVFVRPSNVYCEYVDTGPLAGAGARLDSVLHIRRCEYHWRPLRRERFA
ncbi:MAG: DUF2071 domain-containing protein [Planctomycetota bacterium]|nr:DUF2071 domain-containing protein [Planctomycetota bacterium]